MSIHKSEAESLLRHAQATVSGESGLLAAAQVHAILYLAEQQKYANLIAFMAEYESPTNGDFIRFHGDTFSEITKGIDL